MSYKNVFGEKLSRARHKEMVQARKNRQEFIAAGLGRRDLMKMGLLTSAGYLISKSGLSARAEGSLIPQGQVGSPAVRPFIEPLPIMPIKQPVNSLNPAPTVSPNTAAGEMRTRDHQALTLFPPQKFYTVKQMAANQVMSPDLPIQKLWSFDGNVPGPTYVATQRGAVLKIWAWRLSLGRNPTITPGLYFRSRASVKE